MYSYPAEYLLHPVPVLAIYGLSAASNTDDTKLVDVDEPATDINASPPSTTTTRSGLASSLLSIFTSKSDYTLYEASRYVSSNQIPPPFRVITVSKVRTYCKTCSFYSYWNRTMYYHKNHHQQLPIFHHLIRIFRHCRMIRPYIQTASWHHCGLKSTCIHPVSSLAFMICGIGKQRLDILLDLNGKQGR